MRNEWVFGSSPYRRPIHSLHARARNPGARVRSRTQRLQPDAPEALVTGMAILAFVLQRFVGLTLLAFGLHDRLDILVECRLGNESGSDS